MVKHQRDPISETFYALADPTRRAILERLSNSESSVTELAKPFMEQMSLPAVSKHLRVLEKAGLLTQLRDGRVRRCQLQAAPLQDASDWIAQYRQFWEANLDSLQITLHNLTTTKRSRPGKTIKTIQLRSKYE